MATIEEAKADLLAHYTAQGLYPNKYLDVQVGTSPGNAPCLNVFVKRIFAALIPPESKPGVGYEGFEVVSYKGPVDPANLISDSGPIP